MKLIELSLKKSFFALVVLVLFVLVAFAIMNCKLRNEDREEIRIYSKGGFYKEKMRKGGT